MKNRMRKYILISFVSLISFTAYSQTYTTNNSGNWTDPIWNTSLPTPDPYTIGGSITISSGDNVDVTGGNSITLSSQGSILYVNGTLVISGSLIANKNNQEIHIGAGGMLIVLGDFDVGKNKFVIDAGGYFYVQGQVVVDKTNNQIQVSGDQNIYFQNPPDPTVWPTGDPGDNLPGYNDCYNAATNPCLLPTPIQETIGSNNINASPSTIEGCISIDQSSFSFTLPTASSSDPNYTGNIYYKVIRDYNTGNDLQVGGTGYVLYSGPQSLTITENPSGHIYSVLFYLGSSTTTILPGYKVVPISLSNPPTTGAIN